MMDRLLLPGFEIGLSPLDTDACMVLISATLLSTAFSSYNPVKLTKLDLVRLNL